MIPSNNSDISEWPVAILAGGLATRLKPITETIPKALVPLASEPFLSLQLRLLKSRGIQKVVLCVGHLGEMIQEKFGDGSDWDMEIKYSFDGPKLLGTGGALRKALTLLGEHFLLLNGDSFLPINYKSVVQKFTSSGSTALMTVFKNDGKWDTSNVVFKDGKVICYDKKNLHPEMRYIDYGLTVLNSALLEGPADEVFDISSLLSSLSKNGQLAGHEVEHRFYEVGSHAGLTELDLLLKDTDFLNFLSLHEPASASLR